MPRWRYRGPVIFKRLLAGFNVDWPAWLGTDYRSAVQSAQHFGQAMNQLAFLPGVVLGGTPDLSGLSELGARNLQGFLSAPLAGGIPIIFNLPAFGIVCLVTWVVLIGIRETAGLNTGLAIGKILIVLFFVGLGAFYFRPENWAPFAPNGLKGISSAAAIIFFAYIGFDAVSTAAEETRNPQRDMPIGILGSLVICTVLYVAVAVVLTGMVKWDTLGNAEPLAFAFSSLGMNWIAGIIALGAVLATTSALGPYQAGTAPHFLLHGTRRPAARLGGQSSPALPHSARGDSPYRNHRRHLLLRHQHQRTRRVDQYRHPVRLRPGGARHHHPPPHRPRPPAPLPDAAGAVDPSGSHCLLRLSHGATARRNLEASSLSGWPLGLVIYVLYGFRRSRLAKDSKLPREVSGQLGTPGTTEVHLLAVAPALGLPAMRLLDRYLLRELLVPLGYCLGGFLLFWTVFDLFTSLGRPPGETRCALADIVLYYLVRTPEVLVLILPIALLLALLYALTTHARHHEITAMRAAGISLWRIALPYFVVGFTASLALLALNELAVPDSSDLAERISKRRLPSQAGTLAPGQVRNLAFNNSRERRIWRIGMYDSSTEIMIDPRVVWTLPDGTCALAGCRPR